MSTVVCSFFKLRENEVQQHQAAGCSATSQRLTDLSGSGGVLLVGGGLQLFSQSQDLCVLLLQRCLQMRRRATVTLSSKEEEQSAVD